MGLLQWHYFILILIMMKNIGFGEVGVSHTLKKLFDGGHTFSNTYTTFKAWSLTGCSGICHKTPGCWSFTWDEKSQECALMDAVTATITNTTAPSTLKTYYVIRIGGKLITKTPTAGNTWVPRKAECEILGGRLFLPADSTYAFILHYVFSEKGFWLGMYRDPANKAIWLNMAGETDFPTPLWDVAHNQPDYNQSVGDYILIYKGFMADCLSTVGSYYGLCEV